MYGNPNIKYQMINLGISDAKSRDPGRMKSNMGKKSIIIKKISIINDIKKKF